jgi:aminopeptidase N
VYLIAGKWTQYNRMEGDVLLQAFLRSEDQELADKYLGVTASYLKRYESLVGPYPYSKFALVENFWETGFGMPSFTLLGEKVIRFPWILHSSYPHELLHNWWGNSVYVDYDKGNWCEGITAYMADHLNKELKGEGEAYRRSTLQKFTDFVNDKNDFPLAEFLSRNNAAEEAVGYGKSLMMFHMLRRQYGDDMFIASMQHFYKHNKFRKASFDDIQTSFEYITGEELSSYFTQWVSRKSAPSLKLEMVRVKTEAPIELNFKLIQTQKEDAFDIWIPVAVYLEGEEKAMIHRIHMTERVQHFSLPCSSKPLKIEIDPYFDVMRRLDKAEVPATISRILGAKTIAIVIPFNGRYSEQYLDLANEWKKNFVNQGKKVRVMYDRDLSNLPEEEAIWIFGYSSKYKVFTNNINEQKALLSDEKQAVWKKMDEEESMIYVFANPDNVDQTFGFFGVHDDAAMNALTRKLPHYGKYSYIGFEGEHAQNRIKGVFEIVDSPLIFKMKYASGTPENKAVLPKLKALTDD